MDGYLVKITPDNTAHLIPCHEAPISFEFHTSHIGEDFQWIDHPRGDHLAVIADPTTTSHPRNGWATAYTGRPIHGDALVTGQEMGEDVPLTHTQATSVLAQVFLIGGLATALHTAAATARHH